MVPIQSNVLAANSRSRSEFFAHVGNISTFESQFFVTIIGYGKGIVGE